MELKNKTDVRIPEISEFVDILRNNAFAVKIDLPGSLGIQQAQTIKQGAFARTGRAYQGGKTASLYFDIYVK